MLTILIDVKYAFCILQLPNILFLFAEYLLIKYRCADFVFLKRVAVVCSFYLYRDLRNAILSLKNVESDWMDWCFCFMKFLKLLYSFSDLVHTMMTTSMYRKKIDLLLISSLMYFSSNSGMNMLTNMLLIKL